MLLEKVVEERTKEFQDKNKALVEQATMLNETNTTLEEHQQFIEEQTEELSEKNKTLNTLNATKDKFFSIIAHDLKNPFNSLLGSTEMLVSQYDELDDPTRKQCIGLITFFSQKIYRLLENLLQWARTQTSNLKIKKEAFNIIEPAESNIEPVKNNVREKGIETDVNIPSGARAYTDKNMINTVFRNLITNAIKFTIPQSA